MTIVIYKRSRSPSNEWDRKRKTLFKNKKEKGEKN